MLVANKRAHTLRSPKVGLLNLSGAGSKDLVESDAGFLKPLFVEVQAVDPKSPTCDILFLYADIAADGVVLGADRGLREIIRDSGAKVVIVASPNPGGHYIKAGKQKPYGQANLVMTLDRRGLAFGRFFSALFSKMKRGQSMPAVWLELNPQVSQQEGSDSPETIFACEIGPLTFS